MLVKRLIVQDINGKQVTDNMLADPSTPETIRKEFETTLPVLSVDVDTVGVAVVTIGKALPK